MPCTQAGCVLTLVAGAARGPPGASGRAVMSAMMVRMLVVSDPWDRLWVKALLSWLLVSFTLRELPRLLLVLQRPHWFMSVACWRQSR